MGPDQLRIMLYIAIISHHEMIIIFQMARVRQIPSDVSKEGKRTEFCLSLSRQSPEWVMHDNYYPWTQEKLSINFLNVILETIWQKLLCLW